MTSAHGPRPWQHEFTRVCTMISPEKHKLIVSVVPGGGKGSLPYLLLASSPRSMVQAACHVVPRNNLKFQSEQIPKWLLAYFHTSGIQIPRIRAADNTVPILRGANGYSICWDSVQSAPFLHEQEFQDVGKYALIIDEPQMLSADGVTTRALAPLVDRCSCLVMMSGTFERGDRRCIPFLPYKKTPDGEVIDYEAEGWTTIRYSRREALRDRAILPVEFVLRDARGKFLKGGKTIDFESFNDLNCEEDQRAAIFATLSDQGGWDLAKEMLEAWMSRKQTIQSSQALIMTYSQAEAKEYRSRIKDIYPSMKVSTAISEDPQSHITLNRFRDGKGDILITVGMAYVGFDAPRISHIALLTCIRQRGWIEQAIARGVRIDDKHPYEMQRCVVFAPNDPLLVNIVTKIEAEQEEAVRDRDGGGSGGGEGKEREDMTILLSSLTNTQSHELNTVKLTPELTERCKSALSNHGLSGTPVQLFHAINSCFGEEMQFTPSAPVVGISEQESTLRQALQKRCGKTDAVRKVPFGTTNTEMIEHFNLSRTRMSVAQLTAALSWLQQVYPLP